MRRLISWCVVTLVGAAAVPGAVAQAAPAAPSADPLASLVGTVLDSASGHPLAGAFVQLAPASSATGGRAAVADSSGAFTFAAVPPGRYLATFAHPTTDALGIVMPVRAVDVPPGGSARLDLATPAPARLFAALCGPPTAGDSVGAMVGVVRAAETGMPVAATVVLTWDELLVDSGGTRIERRRVAAPAGADGAFRLCGLPADVAVLARAESQGWRGGAVEVRVPPGGVVYRHLNVADTLGARAVVARAAKGAGRRTVLRGTAAVRGTVRQPDGSPVRGATVAVEGTDVAGRTAENGGFVLAGLPAGTHDVEARAVGYAPARAAIDLRSGATATADLVLGPRVTQLESVVVKGRRDARRLAGLERLAARRRSSVHGTFLTADDIAKRNSAYLSDALRGAPGLRLTPAAGRGLGYYIVGRAGCAPALFVDGMPIRGGANAIDSVVRPGEVLAVEVYAGGAGTPAEFGSGCAIAVWTKR